jgi:hypothetical protein
MPVASSIGLEASTYAQRVVLLGIDADGVQHPLQCGASGNLGGSIVVWSTPVQSWSKSTVYQLGAAGVLTIGVSPTPVNIAFTSGNVSAFFMQDTNQTAQAMPSAGLVVATVVNVRTGNTILSVGMDWSTSQTDYIYAPPSGGTDVTVLAGDLLTLTIATPAWQNTPASTAFALVLYIN